MSILASASVPDLLLTVVARADWATEDQAIDRVHRFGQQKEVRNRPYQRDFEITLTA